jgi:hypothetical protein
MSARQRPVQTPPSGQPALNRCLQRHASAASKTCAPGSNDRSPPPKRLIIGAVDDPLEQEAERVADRLAGNSPVPARHDLANSIRRRGGPAKQGEPAPPSVHRVLSAPGSALDRATRTDMERRFGYDFSQVRVHSDPLAAESARAVCANAYVVGNHMVFGEGKFSPRTSTGRRLIAHELTHVVQQSAPGIDNMLSRDSTFTPAPAAGVTPPSPKPPPLPPTRADTRPPSEPRAGSGLLEGGTAVLKAGIVAAEDGTYLRPKPDTASTPIVHLPFNTTLFVNRDVGRGWFEVFLPDGHFGFVAKQNVSVDLPDPGSHLYRIKSGDTALGIVKQFFKGDAVSWGQDERFYVNVLVYANEQRGRKGICKPSPDAPWDATVVKAASEIWIPSLAFALSLKGKVSSGSVSYEAYRALADVVSAVVDVAIGAAAFVAGLLHGALESLWDTLVGLVELVDLAWKILKNLFSGTLLSNIRPLFSEIASIDIGELAQSGLDWLDKKWNDESVLRRWHFRGWIVGYALAELAMLFFSDGILTAVKATAKIGKFAEVIAKFPKIAKFLDEVKSASKGIKELEAVKAGAKALRTAHEWVVRVLKVPAKILPDLTVQAIERLKKLPAWAQERFAQLADELKIGLLGCHSPCAVDIEAIQKYLAELAAEGDKGKKLVTAEALQGNKKAVAKAVGEALPEGLKLTKIKRYLRKKPALLKLIEKAELTDKELAKLADFITAADEVNSAAGYQTFVRYLTQVTAAKTSNIEKLNEIAAALVVADARQGAALKGAIFEGFTRLHLQRFAGKPFQRATIKIPRKGLRQTDHFVSGVGEIWEIKHQLADKVPKEQVVDYLRAIGRTTTAGEEIKSVNYLFATEEAAKLNDGLVKLGVNVFYVKPPAELVLLH